MGDIDLVGIAAILTAIVAIFTLRYTHKSIKQQHEHNKAALQYTRESIEMQQEHNKNSIRPICALASSTLLDRVSLTFRNNGTGPMKILEASFVSKSSGATYSSLRSFLEIEYPKDYEILKKDKANVRFVTNNLTKNGSFRAGRDMSLLSFERKETGDITAFRKARLKILKMMGEVKITVKYEDIYHNTYDYEFPQRGTEKNHFKKVYEQASSEEVEDIEESNLVTYPSLEKTLAEIFELLKTEPDYLNKHHQNKRGKGPRYLRRHRGSVSKATLITQPKGDDITCQN